MTTRAGGEVVGTRDTFKSGTETQPKRADAGAVLSSSPDNASNAPQVPPGSVSFG